jgi:hypothetical protein
MYLEQPKKSLNLEWREYCIKEFTVDFRPPRSCNLPEVLEENFLLAGQYMTSIG